MEMTAFATDLNAELEGRWMTVDDAQFRVARWRDAMNRLREGSSLAGASGLAVSQLDTDRIAVEGLAEAILLDWKNVTLHGAPLPYTRANAIQLLTEFNDFRNLVFAFANRAANFQAEKDEATRGNSPASSNGPNSGAAT
jgi:hypothetical protein